MKSSLLIIISSRSNGPNRSGPRPKHRVFRHRGDALAANAQELAALQVVDGVLHSPLGEPRSLRDPLKWNAGLSVPRSSPQPEVHQERGRGSVVAYQIAHQDVEDIGVDLDRGLGSALHFANI